MSVPPFDAERWLAQVERAVRYQQQHQLAEGLDHREWERLRYEGPRNLAVEPEPLVEHARRAQAVLDNSPKIQGLSWAEAAAAMQNAAGPVAMGGADYLPDQVYIYLSVGSRSLRGERGCFPGKGRESKASCQIYRVRGTLGMMFKNAIAPTTKGAPSVA